MFRTKGHEKKRALAVALQPGATQAAAAKRERGADPRAKELLELAYQELGDAARAKELYERALAIQEAAYGADHVTVALTLVCLGNAYADLGDAARAKALHERSLAVYEAAFGANHAHVTRTRANLRAAERALCST